MILTKLKDATADKRQMSEQKKGDAAFRQVLDKACEKQAVQNAAPRNITCYTSGYTRNATPFIFQVEQKEYC